MTKTATQDNINYIGKCCMVYSRNGRGRHFVRIIDQSECGRFVKVSSTGAFFGSDRWVYLSECMKPIGSGKLVD